MKALIQFSLLLASGLFLFGCNDNDDHTVKTSPEPVVTATTIVDAAKGAGNFTTLVAALEATGLDATLADTTSKFTVFAPTDDAFELLGQETINGLLQDTDTLSDILAYHVISGEVDAQSALGLTGSTVATVNGAKVALSLDGDSLLINTSTVITTDIKTDNGIIHVIDAVLMPPTSADQAATNIVETAKAAGSFSTLIKALEVTNLDSVLSDGSGKFTVFAPTDAAFAALGQKTINTLLANPDTLAQILKQHVIVGEVDSVSAMSLNGKSAQTVLGNELAISINDQTDSLAFAGVNVLSTDIKTSNGIIHVIDAVVVADVSLPQSFGTIADVANDAGSFNTLIAALSATGLDTLVADPTKTFTVFAPTDEAFAALGQDTIAALLNDTDKLKDILLYHVVADAKVLQDSAVTIASSDDNMVNMANGEKAALSYTDMTLFVNDAVVTTANVNADNGVIHVLNKVIMPPSEQQASSKTIAQTAVETPELSTLVSALQGANLVDTFNDISKTFTVFAPTNNAFKKIPSDTLSALLADQAALSDVLTKHVVADASIDSVGAFSANGKQVTTLAGKALSVNVVDFSSTTNTNTDAVAYSSQAQRLVTGNGSATSGMTVYVFDNDLENNGSTCVDACAQTWMPIIASEDNIKNIPGLSLITRSDSTTQVAYLGRPLYTYSGDSVVGDTKGQGVNNLWWQVSLPTTSLQIAGSNVTVTNIKASNGVVHLIDTVITEAK
ncbi:adhesin [Pseudoalteromonas sp. JBTF-M23]|uniref:Adhesin n=1 Tax=Pseudoalteromonas caenipelagi TaxID=2726988 RepID=A0A849V7P7_9GAMM|nr:fasciclin domain-containing protein [Pseudoalteromonas caenipelagi]NOU49246.1 adhesin [Pseudoalteromonas caenipelagi]